MKLEIYWLNMGHEKKTVINVRLVRAINKQVILQTDKKFHILRFDWPPVIIIYDTEHIEMICFSKYKTEKSIPNESYREL